MMDDTMLDYQFEVLGLEHQDHLDLQPLDREQYNSFCEELKKGLGPQIGVSGLRAGLEREKVISWKAEVGEKSDGLSWIRNAAFVETPYEVVEAAFGAAAEASKP